MQAATKMSDDDAAPRSSVVVCLSSSQIDPRPKGRRGDTGNQSLFPESWSATSFQQFGLREARAQVPPR